MGGCFNNRYSLPEIHFIGGTTTEFSVSFADIVESASVATTSYKARLAVVNYSNKGGRPLLIKDLTIDSASKNIAIKLSSDDTVNLGGKYIYQVTVYHTSGAPEYHKQGILLIGSNINREETIVDPYLASPLTWSNLKNGLGEYNF